MSSFICSAKHFNSIESKLHQLINDNTFYPSYPLKTICPLFYRKGVDAFNNINLEGTKKELSNLINELRELNAICVSLQYKHHYKNNLDEEIKTQLADVKTKTNVKELSLHGLYNALNCVSYQIEIEHLTDLRKLTPKEECAIEFLDQLINCLAMELVRKLPEDKTNTWEVN